MDLLRFSEWLNGVVVLSTDWIVDFVSPFLGVGEGGCYRMRDEPSLLFFSWLAFTALEGVISHGMLSG